MKIPHIGLTGGRCNFCGIKLDNSTRGRTCDKASVVFKQYLRIKGA